MEFPNDPLKLLYYETGPGRCIIDELFSIKSFIPYCDSFPFDDNEFPKNFQDLR